MNKNNPSGRHMPEYVVNKMVDLILKDKIQIGGKKYYLKKMEFFFNHSKNI